MVKDKKPLHIFFWIFYWLLEINIEFTWSKFEKPSIYWLKRLYYSISTETIFLLVKIPLVYCVFFILENRNSYLNSVFRKTFSSLLVFCIAIVIHKIIVHDFFWPFLYHREEPNVRFDSIGLFNGFMDLIFVIAVSFGFEKFRQQFELKEQITKLYSEKIETELKFLKSQINPHFLFNTLNNIYGLSLKKSDETPEIILKLSKIMRYSIFECSKYSVSVASEIENIQDYIDIQKIRYKDLIIQFTHTVDDYSQQISPLILLQFIENAFKYGASENLETSYISIELKLRNRVLDFCVINSKEKQTNIYSTKIGLKNIERQLDLLYANKYELIINEFEKQFSVKLVLLLNE